MREPVVACKTCDKVIWTGDKMWMKGSERYCCGKCLIKSFEKVNCK